MSSVDIAVAGPAELGECPLWSPEEEVLYWVDIEGRRIHRFDPATGTDESRVVPGRPGSLVRTPSPGRLLVAMDTSLAWFDWKSGETAPWRQLEPDGTGNRMNDGRTDPAGRFWVGSMFERSADRRFTGKLHRIEPDGSSRTLRTGVGVSNGLAFDPDRDRMYWADSLRNTVWRYDYDAATGDVRNETPFIDFEPLPGSPDGACVDADGCYWIAAVYGFAVHRFTPAGNLDRTIDLPIEAPTMPAFGGPGLTTLFLTSIGSGGSRTPSPDQHHAGALLAVDAGVTGRVDPPFAAAPPT